MSKISILGSGVVGTTVGKGLLSLGNQVVFYDVNEERVRTLKDSGFNATSQLKGSIVKSEISFVCVPTPATNEGMDLRFVKSAIKNLASTLRKKNEYHLVVIKSTVMPRTTEEIIIPLLNRTSGKAVGPDIGICVNPEFLTEIHHSWTDNKRFSRGFFEEDRILIGEFDERSGSILEALYSPLERPIIRTDLKTAEMVKLASNCALASRISYWNEIFYLCQQLGIDSGQVAQMAAMDERIGTYGTVHGKAFGGKCLPKDLRALIKFSEDLGYAPNLLKAVEEINKRIGTERGVRE